MSLCGVITSSRIAHGGMRKDCRDCLGIRYRICTLHQTWKWLHQTQDLHDHLVSLEASDTDGVIGTC
ncbi:hypothetical protein ANN_22330 [Periplaneta americana]|uniref:Uncharacterized protein n=1 Tax=Periplaneta americana TaxID=6978 RepID=A0ABQ8S817_PERAM|nr:hypothetical protein ANN_22330 [Periplaneta americana]